MKIAYSIIWSVILFIATFPSILFGDCFLNFEGKDIIDILKGYIGPLSMALSLFYLDVVFEYTNKERKGEHLSISLILLPTPIIFIAFFSSFFPKTSGIGFAILWIALTFMRFIVIKDYPKKTIQSKKEIRIINEN